MTLVPPLRSTPEPWRETPQSTLDDGSLPPTLGPLFVAWAESMLVHGEGDLLGRPYVVPEWGRRAAFRVLEFDPSRVESGTGAHPYVVRETLIIAPKGSAKTEFIAALALFLLAGPSLPTPDGPVARRSPNIPVAAASWDQAGRLFTDAARSMAEGTPDSPAPLADFVRCFDAEIQLADGTGKLYRVAAVAGTNDGGLPTAGVADEIHEWTGNKARVHLVLFQGLDKRSNGLVLNITTPDDADPESLLGRKVAYATRIVSGEINDPGFYYLHYAAAAEMPLTNEDGEYDLELVEAAVTVAHPASWLDARSIAQKLVRDGLPEHEFRRYWLGQFVRPGGDWLPPGSWADRSEFFYGERLPPEGTRLVLAFDGSYNRDATALIGCTLDGYLFVVGVWERPTDAPPSWRVPRSEVMSAVADAMERWDVVELAPDPPGWHAEIEVWEDTYGDAVVRFSTNQPSLMVPATGRFYAAVVVDDELDDGEIDESLAEFRSVLRLTHDGDPTLARHLRNVVPKLRPGGEIVTKASRDSTDHIDAAIGAIVAWDRASWHAANGSVVAPMPDLMFL